MSSHIIVVGTNHILQGGEGNPIFIIDPGYRWYIEKIITESRVDFIFEEATNSGPTVAERIAEDRLGKGHYLDIDRIETREALGIGPSQYEVLPPTPQVGFQEIAFRFVVADQKKREMAWLQTIQKNHFNCGLLICGLTHLLSMAFQLESYYSVEARNYSPEQRACRRTHRVTIPGLVLHDGDTERPL
jgi:hypothetical protein